MAQALHRFSDEGGAVEDGGEWTTIATLDPQADTGAVEEAPRRVEKGGAHRGVEGVDAVRDDERREWVQFDLGQAAFSIMLAAADLGIGSGHASVTDQGVARQVLGHPDDRFCPYLIALGYPADRPLAPVAHPKRRSFDEVVHRDRW